MMNISAPGSSVFLPPAAFSHRTTGPETHVKLLDALRSRRQPDTADRPATASDGAECPIRNYDKLDARQVGSRLDGLSQVELEAVEDYERSHADRPQVLDKLRYMRMDEPLPDYDTLSPEQIAEALDGADAETVKGVRDYERKFGHRPEVMDEAARLLATAKSSPEETLAREAREARVRDGYASRAKTARDFQR